MQSMLAREYVSRCGGERREICRIQQRLFLGCSCNPTCVCACAHACMCIFVMCVYDVVWRSVRGTFFRQIFLSFLPFPPSLLLSRYLPFSVRASLSLSLYLSVSFCPDVARAAYLAIPALLREVRRAAARTVTFAVVLPERPERSTSREVAF